MVLSPNLYEERCHFGITLNSTDVVALLSLPCTSLPTADHNYPLTSSANKPARVDPNRSPGGAAFLCKKGKKKIFFACQERVRPWLSERSDSEIKAGLGFSSANRNRLLAVRWCPVVVVYQRGRMMHFDA